MREKKTGKCLRLTEAMARVKLDDDEELVEVWEKDPSMRRWCDGDIVQSHVTGE